MTDYTLDELADLSDTPKRTIRFYVQKGLVEPPFGARKTARYSDRHVEQLLKIKQWKSAGLNLNRISDLLRGDVSPKRLVSAAIPGDITFSTKVFIADGVQLDIDNNKAQLTNDELKHLAQLIGQFVKSKKE